MDKLFKIARINAPHGVRGEVKLSCFLDTPGDILRYNPLISKQGKPYKLRITGHAKDQLIAAIDGIDDRNEAELLRGVELFADKSKLPTKKQNEFYVEELIGLTALTEDGKEIGTVTAIHNFGAGDILEINNDLLLPFKSPFVGDIAGGKVTVTLPEYLEEKE